MLHFYHFFMKYLRRTFQRWIRMLSKNCQIFSIVWWMVFLQRKSFLLSYLFISVSSVHPFRKWTLKQSIQNTWVKSEESLFYIRPGTDNFTLRLLKDSPTGWMTSDQWLSPVMRGDGCYLVQWHKCCHDEITGGHSVSHPVDSSVSWIQR